ncbi:hypothetical protein QVD17_20944 [Tagetes erecta]|uniref:Uncharacterized protein n=1 Tax=Tagetes erecta TaxID=13708 RepID=A0AAD8KTQ8_TARER|nr:hypothetical protein QVD17_20944 [Tagetes erecta]
MLVLYYTKDVHGKDGIVLVEGIVMFFYGFSKYVNKPELYASASLFSFISIHPLSISDFPSLASDLCSHLTPT